MDKPRNFYKNTFHHIYNRGAFQKNIYYNKADYDYFLRVLKKYKRTGVLFEAKTKSKIIQDDSYFKWVIKYILENPVKAKLIDSITEYEFSSANEIFNRKGYKITSVNELLNFFDSLDSLKIFLLDKTQKYSYEF